MGVLVGCVGQLYQGDLDLGRRVAERLTAEKLGPGVFVEELHYGAVAVAQRLQELTPDEVVFVGAAERGRPPGAVERRRIRPVRRDPGEVQRSIADAVTGYVALDLVVEVCSALDALPMRTVAVEVEPFATEPSEELSDAARDGLEVAIDLVRAEVRRAPLLQLADRLWAALDRSRLEPSPALDALAGLLLQLQLVDNEGRWGATFSMRDRLRRQIAEGATGYGMDHLDWVLWWGLIEELDRLQPLESVREA